MIRACFRRLWTTAAAVRSTARTARGSARAEAATGAASAVRRPRRPSSLATSAGRSGGRRTVNGLGAAGFEPGAAARGRSLGRAAVNRFCGSTGCCGGGSAARGWAGGAGATLCGRAREPSLPRPRSCRGRTSRVVLRRTAAGCVDRVVARGMATAARGAVAGSSGRTTTGSGGEATVVVAVEGSSAIAEGGPVAGVATAGAGAGGPGAGAGTATGCERAGSSVSGST
jgi:hypothetical protein